MGRHAKADLTARAVLAKSRSQGVATGFFPGASKGAGPAKVPLLSSGWIVPCHQPSGMLRIHLILGMKPVIPLLAAAVLACHASALGQSPQPALRFTTRPVPGAPATLSLAAPPGGYTIQSAKEVTGPWTDRHNLTVGSEGTADCLLEGPPEPRWFARGRQDAVSDEVVFQTGGSAFEPMVTCAGGLDPAVLWDWHGGVADTDYPVAAIDFGSSAVRTQRLRLFAANHLTSINLGFDGADGGETTPLVHRAGQSVRAVSFVQPLTHLQWWGSSYNPDLASLDFAGFSSLQAIECFHCSNLQQVVASDLPALTRACFESCDLQALDLSGNPNLEDLRGAENAFPGIVVGRGTGPKVWHWCTRDNPQLTQRFADVMGNFTALRELYIWNDNQDGTLAVGSHELTDVQAYNNHLTGASLSNQPLMWNCLLADNALTSISLDGCTALRHLNLSRNQLGSAALDSVLAVLDTDAVALETADLTENAQPPSAAGMVHYANLSSRGVAIMVDLPETNDGRLEVAGGAGAITFVTTSQDPHMEIRVNVANPGHLIWHWGDGTVSTAARIAHHNFGSPGEHTNYVEVDPLGCVTYFGAQQGLTNQGIARVTGASHFPNLDFLYLYQESLTELSIAGCAHLRQLHFANNPVSAAVCDQWFLDLDAAVAGPVTDADFFYPAAARTATSDAARASLIAKGFNMWPY